MRAKKREGLIRARLLGAQFATAPVLLYLDSHCECAPGNIDTSESILHMLINSLRFIGRILGWLEPLLDRIATNPTNVVCPVIDVIDDSTLEFHFRDSTGVNVGGFDWNLQFNWHAVPEREKKRHKVRVLVFPPICAIMRTRISFVLGPRRSTAFSNHGWGVVRH